MTVAAMVTVVVVVIVDGLWMRKKYWIKTKKQLEGTFDFSETIYLFT